MQVEEINNNPLKIFKNFVNYAGPQGKNLYYSVMGEGEGDTFCQFCNEKYKTIKKTFCPCQKIEILDYGQGNSLLNLSQSISACWLIDPFINRVEVGDMICLTAFYFMTP